jgi:hypothetical protein
MNKKYRNNFRENSDRLIRVFFENFMGSNFYAIFAIPLRPNDLYFQLSILDIGSDPLIVVLKIHVPVMLCENQKSFSKQTFEQYAV